MFIMISLCCIYVNFIKYLLLFFVCICIIKIMMFVFKYINRVYVLNQIVNKDIFIIDKFYVYNFIV